MSTYHSDLQTVLAGLPIVRGNVLVAGGTGLIGSVVADLLLEQGQCHVYVLGRNSQRAALRFAAHAHNERFHFVQHDVCQPLPGDTVFHHIIHAASGSGPADFRQSPVEVMLANLHGVEQLLRYGLGHQMQRLLYVSSGEVYGEGNGSDFSESSYGYVDILAPRSCYPQGKRAAETLCAAFASEYGADVVMARPCHTYGPHFTETDDHVYAEFLRHAVRGEDITLRSAGTQYRSWLYVVDCAAALLTVLAKGQTGQAYNVADPDSCVTIRRLATLIADAAGCRVLTDCRPDGNTTPITRATFRTEKIASLGWRPRWSLPEGLAHTLDELHARVGQ